MPTSLRCARRLDEWDFHEGPCRVGPLLAGSVRSFRAPPYSEAMVREVDAALERIYG